MMDSWNFSLPRYLFTILLLQVNIWISDSFLVIGPSEPIVAMLGAETVLPCRVSPPMSVENMELRWFRSQFSEAVYVYQDGVEQVEEQLVDYKGRTKLIKDYITEGSVALRIYSLRVSDNGIYKCLFKKGNDFEEATLELKVIGLGSGPYVSIVGPEDRGIRLRCTGKEWFPQPEIQWKDTKGEKILSLSEKDAQDEDGLYQVEASIIVKDISNREVSCSMKNPFFGQEQVETISIPEPFFPRYFPWKIAFAVTFLILGIFMVAALFLAWKGQQEKKKACIIKEEKENERKKRESLENEMFQRKELYKSHWRKAQLYADWRKEQFIAVNVSLNSSSAHPSLSVTKDEKEVSMSNAVEVLGHEELEPLCSVLGKNSFTDGRHYWDVEVKAKEGTGTRWSVGVCLDTVKRSGWFIECPERNFWVITYVDGKFKVFTSLSESLSLEYQPNRIGVFLDWDGGDVSFYNMDDGSHIYSFTNITFCGSIHPYFSLQGEVVFLIPRLDSASPNSSLKASHFQETKSLLSSS
ncbi:butyrophilin subfamily 1 member A1-like [Suncus etruscus]|uniref:butyrophilin subfamily 1 member A1-like n=1 Tax=Suncus etruscus TaxID=109475 RepID=UPI002110DF73|nr:butyrophilin subfamily 1 member A1-like [Suncus etruscus]